jgi:hypothetical protein
MESGYQGQFNPANAATIAISTTTSSAINLAGFDLCGIQMPAAFTGATISFLASVDGTTYQALHNTVAGTLLSYTVTQGTFVAINPVDFYGVNYFKIVSASSEIAARTLLCAVKGI